MKMDHNYDQICKNAAEMGATAAKVIPVSTVVVAPWVQWKCRYGCPRYGKSKTCPPFAPHYEETAHILRCYNTGILVEGQPPGKGFKEMLIALERKANMLGYYKTFALGAGPCPLCSDCDTAKPCLLPSKARPSMEACGIDVFQTVRNNGFEINFLKHRHEYVKYFGLILLE